MFLEFLGDRSYLTLFDKNPDERACQIDSQCPSQLACRSGICGVLQGPFRVSAGETWVLGDNRNASHDSRSWRNGLGAGVPYANVHGRAMFVWLSVSSERNIEANRLFMDVMGRPVVASNDALRAGLDRCLQQRAAVGTSAPPPLPGDAKGASGGQLGR